MANSRLYIPITFKKEEEWLYDYIMSKSGKSAFIKDVLKQYIANEGITPNEEVALHKKTYQNKAKKAKPPEKQEEKREFTKEMVDNLIGGMMQ